MENAVKIENEFKKDTAKLPSFRDEVLKNIEKQIEGKQIPPVVAGAIENLKNARFDKIDGDKGNLLAAARAAEWDVSRVDLAWVLRSYK